LKHEVLAMSFVRSLPLALALPGLIAAGPLSAETRYTTRAPVTAVEPLYRTVEYRVPTEQCSLVEVPVERDRGHGYRSYTGPILGAIIGGAIGNAVGHNKTNKKVGTAVGAVLGGTIGRDIQHRRERARQAGYRVAYETEEVCETVYEYRERQELDGYEVTYEYAGQEHTTRLDYDPGHYIQVRVQVTPV
jgi:uncharacterized protein YcfJ